MGEMMLEIAATPLYQNQAALARTVSSHIAFVSRFTNYCIARNTLETSLS